MKQHMRKITIIFFLLISTRVLISCCKDAGFNFRWSKASITNIDVSTDTTTQLTQDSSKIANYGFRLSLEYEQLAAHFLNDLGFSKTYALSCESEYPNKDSIVSIEVTTQNEFDNNHPARSSVTDYLLTRLSNVYVGSTPPPYLPISNNIYLINMFVNSELDFKFKPVSPGTGAHTFIITVSFKTGRTLSDTTSIKFY
jgi:hypothetical protein